MPYTDYLQTPEWRRRRDRALARASWACEWPACKRKTDLQVHHKVYEHIGDELDEELAVLCGDHHHHFHRRYEPRGHGDVLMAMTRHMIWRSGKTHFADFIEGLKAACALHELPYNAQALQSALANAAKELQFEEPLRPPPKPLILEHTAFSQLEAREVLTEIVTRQGLTLDRIVHEIPTTPSTPEETVREQARQLRWDAQARRRPVDERLREIFGDTP